MHGQTGWLVPARDVSALAEALQHAIEQPALRERYGRAARAQVSSDFSMERVARETIAIYEELMMTGQKRGAGDNKLQGGR